MYPEQEYSQQNYLLYWLLDGEMGLPGSTSQNEIGRSFKACGKLHIEAAHNYLSPNGRKSQGIQQMTKMSMFRSHRMYTPILFRYRRRGCVIAPSEADDTRAAYLAKTPLV